MADQTNPINITDASDRVDFMSLLTFKIGEQRYGLVIADVMQIIEMVTIIHLPGLPEYIQGVINVRGEMILTIDMRQRFGLPFQPYDSHTPVILTNTDERKLGLIVDKVEEVLKISPADLETSAVLIPSELISEQDKISPMVYFSGVARAQRQLIPILDLRTLFRPEEQAEVTEIMSQEFGAEGALS
jgi:purine-binding chemotaxis protein CheW